MTRDQLEYIGWGIVGEPQPDIIRKGPSGPTIEVYGYSESDYWENGEFLGPDMFGIVPIYTTPDGKQFPSHAKEYPFFA